MSGLSDLSRPLILRIAAVLVVGTLAGAACARLSLIASRDPTPQESNSAAEGASSPGPDTDPAIAGPCRIPERSFASKTGSHRPILVLDSADNSHCYMTEVLSAEGINAFDYASLESTPAESYSAYSLIIALSDRYTDAQLAQLKAWAEGGGQLVLIRPPQAAAALGGLTPKSAPLSAETARLRVGDHPLQLHVEVDAYEPGVSQVLAQAADGPGERGGARLPAVLSTALGAGGVTVFAYDLSKSIWLVRQGNPAWSRQEHDDVPGLRASDLLVNADHVGDWLDLAMLPIPQADEQMRFFTRVLERALQKTLPLPRLWYFPWQKRSVLMVTGDEDTLAHMEPETPRRYEHLRQLSPAGCDVSRWECARGSSYGQPETSTPDEVVSRGETEGFEYGPHLWLADCPSPVFAHIHKEMGTGLKALKAKLPSFPQPASIRNHGLRWCDYDSTPRANLAYGIRLDVNYYQFQSFPNVWKRAPPGFITGTALPMRFANRDGKLTDVYQAVTQITDTYGAEKDRAAHDYSVEIPKLFAKAKGDEGYAGAFVANIHTNIGVADWRESLVEQVVRAAQSAGFPVITPRQLLEWVDLRGATSFEDVRYDAGTEAGPNAGVATLRFRVQSLSGASPLPADERLTGMLPTEWGGKKLKTVLRAGTPLPFSELTIRTEKRSFFSLTPGAYEAKYAE